MGEGAGARGAGAGRAGADVDESAGAAAVAATGAGALAIIGPASGPAAEDIVAVAGDAGVGLAAAGSGAGPEDGGALGAFCSIRGGSGWLPGAPRGASPSGCWSGACARSARVATTRGTERPACGFAAPGRRPARKRRIESRKRGGCMRAGTGVRPDCETGPTEVEIGTERHLYSNRAQMHGFVAAKKQKAPSQGPWKSGGRQSGSRLVAALAVAALVRVVRLGRLLGGRRGARSLGEGRAGGECEGGGDKGDESTFHFGQSFVQMRK